MQVLEENNEMEGSHRLDLTNREEPVENAMQNINCVTVNIKRIHDLQQKEGQRRKQRWTISDLKKKKKNQ